jgi:hypothetical protein
MATNGGPTVACGHRCPGAGVAVCEHLRPTTPGHVASYFWYAGIGLSVELEQWHQSNPWESDDGQSRRSLGSRAYYWTHGICWLDNEHVAIEGIGDDDDDIVPGVVIYNANPESAAPAVINRPPAEIGSEWPTATETTAFGGPAGTLFGSNDQLFSVSDQGLSIWSVDTGTRTGYIAGFLPQYQDRAAGNLIELQDHSIRIWRYQS